jgi:hypothetical protein
MNIVLSSVNSSRAQIFKYEDIIIVLNLIPLYVLTETEGYCSSMVVQCNMCNEHITTQ